MAESVRVEPKWAMPPGYITEATQRAGIQGLRSAVPQAQCRSGGALDHRDEGHSSSRLCDVGFAGEVVEQLTDGRATSMSATLMMLLPCRHMNKDLAKYNTKLFAERVMPKLKHIHGEWEDKWWPEPMAAPERAELPPFAAAHAAE